MIAAVVVHYRTPALLRETVDALRQAKGDLDVVVVDNGGGELPPLPARLLRAPRNLGYAGGINLGVASTTAEHLLVMNADVIVDPGCVEGLVATLEEGYGAAGPRQYWDRAHTFLLPPLEIQTPAADWMRRAAPAAWVRARWRAHAWRHWNAESTVPSPWLSGALLALRRDAWRAVGPFDDGYWLYFEEVDWLARLWRAGLRSAYVPGATCVHLYNQSLRQTPGARDQFVRSQRRFRRHHYGRGHVWLLALMPRIARLALPAGPRRSAEAGVTVERPGWLEIASSPAGYPAAAARVSPGVWRLSESLRGQMASGAYRLTLVDLGGHETGRFTLAIP